MMQSLTGKMIGENMLCHDNKNTQTQIQNSNIIQTQLA